MLAGYLPYMTLPALMGTKNLFLSLNEDASP